MADSISVVIPVGPLPHHRAYLTEALDSLTTQTRPPNLVVLVNDGGPDIDTWAQADLAMGLQGPPYHTIQNEMRLGMVASWNRGIAYAASLEHGLAISMGADDRLLPHALADAETTWKRHRKEAAWYYFDVVYSDSGKTQSVPCHAAMVHADWYKSIGGLPPESAVGAPDSMLISMIMAKRIKADLINIKSATPPYWYRVHELTDTRIRQRDTNLQQAIHLVRTHLTEHGNPNGAVA